ncbi:LysR family transcriptional regulator [Alteromonas sediminis]|uniref:LysR family transcriptional regulator n=1 Tax=Alteromonas sediminis TaxID=2259342 RepID=A0A3N5XZ99_9ALTE|nr:LysR family transcriptional regulator [Alteromonas sediminis]RPJ65823.1 LysR family transcriptional regulator [Alteromonas sediminis]
MRKTFHTRQLTFRQLEIFKTVAERNSVTEAAQVLHLAQSTVSTQLAKLVQTTGFELYEQIGKKLYLTGAGKDMLAACRDMFDVLDALESRFAQRAGLSVGHLRISAVTTSKYLVPNWLGSFCRQFPEIEPEFNIGNRAEIIQRLKANMDDLYIFSHLPKELDIHATPITDNPLVLIAPKGHHLTTCTNLSWEHVRKERFLIREKGSGTRHAVEAFFNMYGAPLMRPLGIASNEAIKESVVAGLGVAIISRHALSHMAPGNLVELNVKEFPIPSTWYLVTPKGKAMSPVTQAFSTHVDAMLGCK